MYRLFNPAPSLRPYIDSYWLLNIDTVSDAVFYEAIAADGQADILFNFGTPYKRMCLDGTEQVITASNLDGHRDYPITIAQVGAIRIVGVRFRIGGLAPFLQIPMDSLVNQVVSVREAFGTAHDELESRLYEAQNQAVTQIALLDAFFLQRLATTHMQSLISLTTQRLIHCGGQQSVQQISESVGYSVRSLNRLFLRHTGFTPKRITRMIRIQAVLALLDQNPHMSLVEMARLKGFTDQAHMSHDFKDLTGQTLSQYRQNALNRLAKR